MEVKNQSCAGPFARLVVGARFDQAVADQDVVLAEVASVAAELGTGAAVDEEAFAVAVRIAGAVEDTLGIAGVWAGEAAEVVEGLAVLALEQ